MASPVQSSFIYGTAWKKDETAVLVSQAIRSGFCGFDTAGQPKHYREDLVGQAIREAFTSGLIKNRTDIYIQTKFSRPPVQDPLNAPYSMDSPLEEQVHDSIKNSLHNLGHDDNEESSYIDTLILHSPYPDFADTVRAWRVFESYIPDRIRALGISNITFPVLQQLYAAVKTKPALVQVRFHPESEFATTIRQFCAEKNIVFQAHKVLKGNLALLESDILREIASEVGISREIALYLCVLGLPGSLRVVNGTKSEDHMKEDLDSLRIFKQWHLNPDHRASWEQRMIQFKGLIGD